MDWSNGLVNGYGNHYAYGGNYTEDYQMSEHFWNLFTNGESKVTYSNGIGDAEVGIDAHFHDDFKDKMVCEETEIEVCVDNDFHSNYSDDMIPDVRTDDVEVENYPYARFRVEDFPDMTTEYSHVEVPDDSYIEVASDKQTYYSHASAPSSPKNLDDYKTEFIKATKKGGWEVMKEIAAVRPDILSMTSSKFHDAGTALHHTLWYGGERERIARCLVDLMTPKDLETLDVNGYTTLSHASCLHHENDLLDYMIDKNEDLPNIGPSVRIPVVDSSWKGFTDTTEHLYPLTDKQVLSPTYKNPLDVPDDPKLNVPYDLKSDRPGRAGINLLNQCINLYLFDIAKNLLELYPTLLRRKDDNRMYPIHALVKAIAALRSSDIQHQKSREWKLWGAEKKSTNIREAYKLLRFITRLKDFEIDIENSDFIAGAMMEAAKHGIVEFINEMLKVDRELINVAKNRRNIFWYAIVNRQEKVFNLIYGCNQSKDQLLSFKLEGEEKETYNVLHFAAELPPSLELDRVSGPALQMQRELQWFQVLNDIRKRRLTFPAKSQLFPVSAGLTEDGSYKMPIRVECSSLYFIPAPHFKEQAVRGVAKTRYQGNVNMLNETPYVLFLKAHKDLLEEGEKSMKKTALAASTVGGLIVTTMFSAALSVITAVYQTPTSGMYGVNTFFIAFLILATLSLCSCTASIIVFLRILASRYSPEDFLYSLPRKFMIGFWALFTAITTMMLSFCCALYVMLRGRKVHFVIVPIFLFSLVPVAGFVIYLCPLLWKISRSTNKTIFDENTKLPEHKKESSYECC